VDSDGNEWVRFQPLPAYLTADAMERLCASMNKVIDDGRYDPFLIMPILF